MFLRHSILMGSRLRICFMPHRFNLSDPGMEDTLYDVDCKASPQYKLTEANKRFNRNVVDLSGDDNASYRARRPVNGKSIDALPLFLEFGYDCLGMLSSDGCVSRIAI